jgi:DUF218 domain-containing protein
MPALLFVLLAAAASAQEPVRAPLPLRNPLQDKNFYVLSLLERCEAIRPLLPREGAVRVKTAINCPPELTCFTHAMLLSDRDIGAADNSLRTLQRTSQAFRDCVTAPMRSSGLYQLHSVLSDEELVSWAWQDAAHGINRAISIYGEGAAPHYPDIDSIAFDPKSDSFRTLVHVILTGLNDEIDSYPLFFQASLEFALRLMEANKRDEAGRFEPMDTGVNRDVIQRIKTIRWSDYPYSVILIPGSGTDRLSWNLSPYGMERMRLAVRRYREKKAPLIIVSGGFVHPNQTPYAEAIEMKKVLVSRFEIPENDIIVEPHARHTTTNIRNAVRLIWRYGIPLDKPGLITTDVYHSKTIGSDDFLKRNERELGYQPAELGRRISDFDIEFVPRLDSLQLDATELLDP